MVVIPLVSLLYTGWPFGFASAPYDSHWADRHPHRAAWMALAGPASNLLLVIISVLLMWLGVQSGFFAFPEGQPKDFSIIADNGSQLSIAFALLVNKFIFLNLLLTVLNLIPLPPLDGSSAISLLFSEKSARRIQERMQVFSRSPFLAIMGLMLAWTLLDPIFGKIWSILREVVYELTRL